MEEEIDLGGSISTRFGVYRINKTHKGPENVVIKKRKKKEAFEIAKRRRVEGNRLDFN